MEKAKKLTLIMAIVAGIYGLYDVIKGIARLMDDRGGVIHIVFGVIFIVLAIRGFSSYRKLKELGDDDDDDQ